MGVPLGLRDALVPEELLHFLQRPTLHHELAREVVAAIVEVEILDASPLRRPRNAFLTLSRNRPGCHCAEARSGRHRRPGSSESRGCVFVRSSRSTPRAKSTRDHSSPINLRLPHPGIERDRDDRVEPGASARRHVHRRSDSGAAPPVLSPAARAAPSRGSRTLRRPPGEEWPAGCSARG